MTPAGWLEIDWVNVYRALVHGKPRLRVAEVERLTFAELSLYLDQDLDDTRPRDGGDQGGDTEAYARWWWSLTPLDRLRRAADIREGL